jgi:hypothetical protein
MFPRHAALLLFALVTVFTLPIVVLRAENLTVHGVTFPLSKGVEVGGGLIELSLPNGKKLVSIESLEELIVTTFLGKQGEVPPPQAKQISIQELVMLAHNAAKSDSPYTASRALAALLYRLPSGSKAAEKIIVRLSEESGTTAQSVFRPLLTQRFLWQKFPAVGIKMLTSTELITDTKTVRTIALLIDVLPTNVRADIEGIFFIRVLAKDYLAARSLLVLIRADTTTSSSVNTLESILTSAQKSTSTEKALVAVIAEAQKDALVWKQIRLEIAERLPIAILELLEQENLEKAFELISAARFQDRTPKLHAIVLQALQAVIHHSESFILTPQLQLLLRKFAENDDEIRRAFIEVLKNKILYLIEQHKVAELQSYWDYLLAVNPDPDTVNTELRYHLARSFIADPFPGTVRLVNEALENLPLLQSLFLRLRKLYKNLPFIEAIVGFCFIGLCILLLRLRWRSSLRSEKTKTTNDDAAAVDSESLFDQDEAVRRVARFGASGLKRAQDPRVAEYDSCLLMLELERGASPKEIKSAYRKLVKIKHPDMARGDSEEASIEGFMKLKEAYERLLELEKDDAFTLIKSGLGPKTSR